MVYTLLNLQESKHVFLHGYIGKPQKVIFFGARPLTRSYISLDVLNVQNVHSNNCTINENQNYKLKLCYICIICIHYRKYPEIRTKFMRYMYAYTINSLDSLINGPGHLN